MDSYPTCRTGSYLCVAVKSLEEFLYQAKVDLDDMYDHDEDTTCYGAQNIHYRDRAVTHLVGWKLAAMTPSD